MYIAREMPSRPVIRISHNLAFQMLHLWLSHLLKP
jgi:hypothetical protein